MLKACVLVGLSYQPLASCFADYVDMNVSI